MLISFLRAIKFAFQDFYRNIWLSFVTIVILVLSFLSVSFLIIFSVIANETIKNIENKVDISVYFKPEIAETEISRAELQLLALPWAKNIKHLSKEQSLEEFKIKHSDNKNLMEALKELDSNPLGVTLIVTAKDINGYKNIINTLSGNDFKDKIQNTNFNDYNKAIDNLTFINRKIKKAGLIACILFALISILVVFYTIKISIYTHKDEIIIMKLVGADNFFIKAPFLLECIIYTCLACAIALILFLPLLKLRFFGSYIDSFFAGTEFNSIKYLQKNIFYIAGWQLIGALILNLISSSLALRKYLKY